MGDIIYMVCSSIEVILCRTLWLPRIMTEHVVDIGNGVPRISTGIRFMYTEGVYVGMEEGVSIMLGGV